MEGAAVERDRVLERYAEAVLALRVGLSAAAARLEAAERRVAATASAERATSQAWEAARAGFRTGGPLAPWINAHERRRMAIEAHVAACAERARAALEARRFAGPRPGSPGGDRPRGGGAAMSQVQPDVDLSALARPENVSAASEAEQAAHRRSAGAAAGLRGRAGVDAHGSLPSGSRGDRRAAAPAERRAVRVSRVGGRRGPGLGVDRARPLPSPRHRARGRDRGGTPGPGVGSGDRGAGRGAARRRRGAHRAGRGGRGARDPEGGARAGRRAPGHRPRAARRGAGRDRGA